MSYERTYRERKALQLALMKWLGSGRFTHAIHLAPNRKSLTNRQLRALFSGFCLEFDRYLLDAKHVYHRASRDRLLMVAMPEKLEGNPHLHCAADLSPFIPTGRIGPNLNLIVEDIWVDVTRGSGEVRIEDKFDANYLTKEAWRHDRDFLVSWDYHPDRKLHLPSAFNVSGTGRNCARSVTNAS